MEYRREIDGLRALAVVPVVFYHAGFTLFSGGFVGVDVFFVISGYLITSIIIAELEQGKFSVVNFYERRARRILPALFLVVLTCLPFAWLWLMPAALKDFSQSLVAVSTFASNILFWQESNYFATNAELKPLLHTWSLAVEEQYYVVFPLLLMLAWRLDRRWLIGFLTILFLSSLLLAEWGSRVDPTATFYLLPSRGWELLMGSFVAFHLRYRKLAVPPRWLAEAGGTAGVLLVLFAIFVFDRNYPFPSLYTLIPTAGTALVILFATSRTTIGTLVGHPAFVAIGLISYSTYLWHQPLFAFAKLRSLSEPGPILLMSLSVLSFVLAYFSWKWVEAPFRNKARFDRRAIFTCSLIASLLAIAIGLVGHFAKGFPSRFDPAILRVQFPDSGFINNCGDGPEESCRLGERNLRPTIALLGDSHSGALWRELDTELKTIHRSALAFKGGWCVPLLDVGTSDPKKNPACREIMSAAFSHVLSNSDIRYIVLVSEWSNYTEGYRWNDSGIAFYTDSLSRVPSLQENRETIKRGLERTLDAAARSGKHLILVKPTPEYEIDVPTELAKHLKFSGSASLGGREISVIEYSARNRVFEGILDELGVAARASLISPATIFCETGPCEFLEDGESLYSDGNHLSNKGAQRLVPHIVRLLGQDGYLPAGVPRH
ncbi:MAG: acyltransferase [Pseudomonadales bacterium]|nr:acyltransferase [Pseudomonadales bacterium]